MSSMSSSHRLASLPIKKTEQHVLLKASVIQTKFHPVIFWINFDYRLKRSCLRAFVSNLEMVLSDQNTSVCCSQLAIVLNNIAKLMEIDPTVSNVVKIVTVGDALVGKSCAITKFKTSVTPIERQSTIFDSSTANIIIDGKQVELSLWDTTGKIQYKEIRKSVYRGTDIFLIFFSVINPQSFTNAVTKWLPEVREANEKALVVFIGNKIDLRRNQQVNSSVSQAQAARTIEQELRQKYIECSALTGEGLSQAFEYCVKEHLNRKFPNTTNKVKRNTNTQGCCQIM